MLGCKLVVRSRVKRDMNGEMRELTSAILTVSAMLYSSLSNQRKI